MNWSIGIGIVLVVLKQLFKLHVHHRPDFVDYVKAAATLPVDISFLIVALFFRQASDATSSVHKTSCIGLLYVAFSLIVTVLWRMSDNATTGCLQRRFFVVFPLNLAVASAGFYLALRLV